MSEQEFENWLALLSGLLRLSPEQRNNISEELRSHLEERMEDLIDAGSSREEAIAAALEEFGDTAALAQHFTSIAHQKRRRLMRYTYGTIAAVTCAILVLATFWPAPQGPAIQNVAAQSEPEEAASGASALGSLMAPATKTDNGKTSDPFAGSREKIEAKLAEPCEAKYSQMPLREVLEDLSSRLEITILLDPAEVGELIDPDVPISIEVGPNAVSGKTLLRDFILSPNDLIYTIRDNSVLVSTYDRFLSSDSYEVVVYNCRDLLARMPGKLSSRNTGREPESSRIAFTNEQAAPPGTGSGGGTPGGSQAADGGAGATPGSLPPAPSPVLVTGLAARERQLMSVIQTTIRNGDCPWDDGSSISDEHVGAMEAINGLLVIRQTREMHAKIEQLLELLREATKQGDWPAGVEDWPDYEIYLPYGGSRPAGGGGFNGGPGGYVGGGGFF